MIAIADTSFVVAVAVETDRRHSDCIRVFKQFRYIVLPQSLLAETAFMIRKAGGNRAVIHFLRYLPVSPKFNVEPLMPADFLRTADLLERYADSRLDFVDASIAAVAERLNITRVLTLDQRDFSILRPRHIARFEILPQQSG